MLGTIARLQVMNGKYGKFTNIEVNGEKIAAFKDWQNVAVGLKEGDQIEYEVVMNGEFKNFKFLKLASAGGAMQAVARGEFFPKDVSMIVSYAKDLMVGGVCSQEDSAVKMVFNLIDLTKKAIATGGVNPTT